MAEVVVVITGSGLTEEQGCGVCVQRLTETLRELRMVIQNSSSLLPSVNSTQEDLLGDGIMESQVSGTSKEFSDHTLPHAWFFRVVGRRGEGGERNVLL